MAKAKLSLCPADLTGKSLRTVCEKGNFSKLFEMIDSGKVLCTGYVGSLGSQPLHYASAHGNLKVVSELIDKYKCNPSCENGKGLTPLHLAAMYGRIQVVKYLISLSCSPEGSDICCRKALYYVCKPGANVLSISEVSSLGHVKIMKFLFDHGRDLHKKNLAEDEALVIDLVLSAGKVEDMKYLVNQGYITKPNLQEKMCKLINDYSNPTKYFCDIEIVKYLLSLDAITVSPELIVKVAKGGVNEDIVLCMMKNFTGNLSTSMVIVPNSEFRHSVECSRTSLVLDYVCQQNLFVIFRALAEDNLNYHDPKGRSLVYVACEHDKHDFVSYLVAKKCSLDLATFEGQLPLHIACKHACIEVVKLVSVHVDVDQQDYSGNTPLHIACKHNKTEAVEYLSISKHCKQDLTNLNAELPLHVACVHAGIKVVKYVSSVDVNQRDGSGNTPLHIACIHAKTEVIKYLATVKHCKQNIFNQKVELPLHIAVSYNNIPLEIVQDISSELTNLSADVADTDGHTPMHRACKQRYNPAEVIEYLACELGCGLDKPDGQGILPLNTILSSYYVSDGCVNSVIKMIRSQPDFNVDAEDSRGNTLLHCACSKKCLELIRYLIVEKRCDVNKVGANGDLPLHIACRHYSLDMAKLVSNGASEGSLYIRNESRRTPWHILVEGWYMSTMSKIARHLVEVICHSRSEQNYSSALMDLKIDPICAKEQDFEILKLLATKENVKHSSLVRACENNNLSAVKLLQSLNFIHSPDLLHIACSKSAEMVKLVIHDDDVNEKNYSGLTPLHLACRHNQVSVIELLIQKYRCNQFVHAPYNGLPLHLACAQSLDAVKLLTLNSEVIVMTHCNEGFTPLHIACKFNKFDIVQYLISAVEHSSIISAVNPLPLACKTGNVELVKFLTEKGINTDSISSGSYTPLHIACSIGCVEVAKYLVDSGHDTSIKNSSNELPLHIACTKSLELVKLTSYKCTVKEVEAKGPGNATPLHLASAYGHLDIVEYLIDEKKCSPFSLDEDGRNALAYACGFGEMQDEVHVDVARYLVKCGCSPAENFSYDWYDSSLIEWAIELEHYELFKVLVEGEANINCQDKQGNTPLMLLCQSSCERKFALKSIKFLLSMSCDQQIINVVDEVALHLACERNIPQVITLLDPHYVASADANGDTPLHVIACKRKYSPVWNHLQMFLSNACNLQNKHGQVPLHLAVTNRSITVTKIMCRVEGIVSTIKDNKDSSPIHYACVLPSPCGVLQALIKHDRANLEVEDADGNTPLHTISCKKGKHIFKSVKCLLSHGASAKATNNDGDTPLHLACRTGSAKSVEALVRKGYALIQNKAGDTPLHIACEQKNLGFVKLLCKGTKECGLTTPNLAGNTPLHIACTAASFEIVDYFTRMHKNSCVSVLALKNRCGSIPFHIALGLLCQTSNEYSYNFSMPSFPGSEELAHNLLCFFTNHCENIDVQNANDETLLHLACKINHCALELVTYFVQCCEASLIIPDMHLQFPLHCAASRSLEMVKLCCVQEIVNARDSLGNTPLHLACLTGENDVVKFLIQDMKCDIDITNEKGQLPLHCACLNDATSQLTIELLAKVENISTQDINGDTPLHLACKSSHAKWVFVLQHCDMSLQNNLGQTPLHIACSESSLDVVQLVLNCDPHYQLKQDPCDTALHIACRKHSLDIIECLLESKHKEASNIPNIHGELPIHIACAGLSYDSLPIIEALSKHVVNLNSQTKVGDTPLHLVVGRYSRAIKFLVCDLKCNISIINNNGDTPLHIACRSEYLSIEVIKLLACKGNINIQNKDKNTVIHEFCLKQIIPMCYYKIVTEEDTSEEDGTEEDESGKSEGNSETEEDAESEDMESEDASCPKVVELVCLKKTGAKLDAPNAAGEYPMHLACRLQTLEVVKLFEPHGLTIKTAVGNSVLHEACGNTTKRANEIIEYLLAYSPALDLKSVNNDHELALHVASRNSYLSQKVFESLMKRNPINAKNKDGDTPLHVLIKSKASADVIETMINHEKCDPSVPNNQQQTPLFLACKGNLKKVVHVLLTKQLPGVNNSIHLADDKGQTPVMMTTDAKIVDILLKYGADPAPLYEMHREFFEKFGGSNTPLKTPVSVLVIGHPGVGKTTLISSLKEEKGGTVSEISERTAGVVPNDFDSQFYGQVIMYDFAGQPEYYASHDAVIHNTIKKSPPIVLLVVDIRQKNEETMRNICFWSDLVKNRLVSLTDKAHLYIICSHADALEGDPQLKAKQLLSAVEINLNSFKFRKIVTMNCTQPQSKNIDNLRKLLTESTEQLRHKGVINFRAHCLAIFLKQTFKNNVVIPLKKLEYEASCAVNKKLIGHDLVPKDQELLKELCNELNESGIVMFLEDQNLVDLSWIVLDKDALLNDVCGKLFSPDTFPEYVGQYGSNTGVVCFSKLKKIFPHHPPSMLFGFLCKMEYCGEIRDEKVVDHMLKQIALDENEKYYFFPSVIKVERPPKEWEHLHKPGYQFGWIMECANGHFSPSFVQILLLRLMFGSTKIKRLPKAPLDIHSMSTVWKSGILWSDKGIQTIVDVVENSILLVLIHCNPKDEVICLRHRSRLLQTVRCIKHEICPVVETKEFFITPKYIHHPLKLPCNDILVSLNDLIQSVSAGDRYVYSAGNDEIELEDILLFDPYRNLCDTLSAAIQNPANSHKAPSDEFLTALANHLYAYFDLFLKIVDTSPKLLEKIGEHLHRSEKFLCLFEIWLKRIGRSFGSIKNEFDFITVFELDSRLPGNLSASY